MSGSSGGSYVAPQSSKFDCETGVIITTVSSINIVVLNKYRVGVVLDVHLGKNESLILEDGDGEILGTILHPNTVDIIECIKLGSLYEAEIVFINSPSCRVKIKGK